MTEPTVLDLAHAGMEGSDAARLRFFALLADTELHVLLEREAAGDTIEPKLFVVEDGEVALAFDTEARLAAFVGGSAAFATLPGRGLAAILAEQRLGLGVNLGASPSAMLLPPDALDWLIGALGAVVPDQTVDRIAGLFPPDSFPDELLEALAERLGRASGLAERALLARARYGDGRARHLLAILGAKDRDQPALARAVSEALTFSGVEEGEIDVAFLDSAHPVVARLGRVAMRLDIPAPAAPGITAPQAPGSDPARPPKLR